MEIFVRYNNNDQEYSDSNMSNLDNVYFVYFCSVGTTTLKTFKKIPSNVSFGYGFERCELQLFYDPLKSYNFFLCLKNSFRFFQSFFIS